ncbi:MAG TPA: LD-carboxypeptidase [Gemmatimonadales bacterium]|nr:LD-carboxypeptidase [Gemmatimonadales bacterium]
MASAGGQNGATRPPKLLAGARVALVAPSGPLLERDDIARAAELCCALGHEPVVGAHAARRDGYLAGTDRERLADLNAALAEDRIDAVWCLRGGYGVTRLLPGVDFAAFARRPKPVIGFSDITALLNALTRATGVVTFHGPTARQPMSAFTRRHFERVLGAPAPVGRLERLRGPADVLLPRMPRIATIVGGRAEGPLIGGNLTLLQCLVGTPWQPAFDRALLFLEDVGEDLYRVDRVLSHLRLAGLLERLAGVVVGQFTDMKRATSDGGLGFDEVLASYFEPLGIPVAMGFPIGHVDDQWTMPIGVRARLDARAGEVELLEAAVA